MREEQKEKGREKRIFSWAQSSFVGVLLKRGKVMLAIKDLRANATPSSAVAFVNHFQYS